MWYRSIPALCCIALVMAGCADQKLGSPAAATPGDSAKEKKFSFLAVAVRYQVRDVDRSIAFYTKHFDFRLDQQAGVAFAKITNGNLSLYLSGPKASGSRPMPDGRRQEPEGWNRLILDVDDLASHVAAMKKAGQHFRNEIETGPGGKQIQLEDPDGNPVELHEPAGQASETKGPG